MVKHKLWYPSLLQTANGVSINSHSWFNIKQVNNPSPIKNNLKPKKINTTFIQTKKFIIYPNDKQKTILQRWFHAVVNMYNISNSHLKELYEEKQDICSFFDLRKELLYDANILIKNTEITKHTLDYSIKHCIEMYKSAISNLRNGHIDHFDISNLKHNRNRFNLVIEPNSFSKKLDGFFVSKLGEMKYERKLNHLITKNCILQYNKTKDKYYLIMPFDSKLETTLTKDKLCGIDLGVRTFATVYSKNESLEIGNNLIPTIDLYNKRKDQLKSLIDTKCISGKLYRKLMNKYGSNMRNKIDDLHKKVSVMLVKKFKTINIGKISTKSIVSNETSNLSDLNKRRLLTLSFYRFLERLKFFGKKYDSKINLLSEYKTSMSCNNCGNEDKNLGNSKIYNCSKCRLVIDRDINSAIIFYKGGYDCLN